MTRTDSTQVTCILFVDDSDDEVFISNIAFERDDFRIELRHFFDLDSYFSALDEFTPDQLVSSLTILDLNLTVSRGTEGVQRLRSQRQFDQHIVGICSGSDDPADRQASIDSGASFFIAKPLNPGALIAICKRVGPLRIEERNGEKILLRNAVT